MAVRGCIAMKAMGRDNHTSEQDDSTEDHWSSVGLYGYLDEGGRVVILGRTDDGEGPSGSISGFRLPCECKLTLQSRVVVGYEKTGVTND